MLSQSHYYGNEQHFDLWTYLLNVFSLYETPIGKKLGIQPLAGDLFSTHAMPHLYQCQLNNQVLLEVFRGLCFFENEQGQYLPVNYKSLDVEEFGSVYEGLLELDPAIDVTAHRFSFVQGDDRSISGSHYTPDELVQPLIKHSLEHLIQDILKEQITNEQKVKKLLQLTVCDVACGSGHILLAAAQRIGLAVARLRSGEEQPNPTDTRKGIRDAIKHCIYGVDKNPLAVELCKVAMWLEAHVPGEPLNFLDHKIKNGDAIVGLAHLDELYNGISTEAFKAYRDEEKDNCRLLKKSNRKQRKAREAGQLRTHNIKEIVENKLAKFKERFEVFQTLPEKTVEELEAKKKAYKKLNAGTNWWAVKTLADLQVAQFFVDKSDIANVVTDDDYFDIMAGRKAQTKAEVLAITEAEQRKFFHWFLEFPEVFGEGGFDCIVGNPPYLGGSKISTNFGHKYSTYLMEYFPQSFGMANFVSYFIKRMYFILKQLRFFSLISTDKISEGITRKSSLEYLTGNGSEINFAIRSIPWIGIANVDVAVLSIFKGTWGKERILNGEKVDNINSYLEDQSSSKTKSPFILLDNKSKSFTGSKIYGNGFILNANEVINLIEKNHKNKEVINPYLSGDDINSHPEQKTDRYVINFKDLPFSNYLKSKSGSEGPPYVVDYPDCLNIVEQKVKPDREKLKPEESASKYWWRYQRIRKELYNSISGHHEVLVFGQTSKHISPVFVANGQVYSVKCVVFSFYKYYQFALLQSAFHLNWAWKYKTSMGGSRIQYATKSCFETFPFPKIISKTLRERLEGIGKNYHEFRRLSMFEIQIGLTKIYNQFHNKDLVSDLAKDISTLKDADIKKALSKESWNLYNHLQKTEGTIPFTESVGKIQELRRLHGQMDKAVLEAYGWHQSSKRWGPAIELRHDFYEVDYLPENDRVRYTIHPEARREVLKRLLLLNHEIHESEERGIPYEELDREKIIELYREEIGSWLKHPETPHTKTIKYLAYGEDLLPDLQRKDIKEYSPYVAEICKAIENEILQKLFIPFNVQFQEEWQDREKEELATFIDEVGEDNRMGKFSKNLKNNNVKYTLGDMHWILNLVFSKSLKDNHLLQAFKGFVFSKYKDSFINKDTMKELDQLTLLYRNASAHADEKYEGDLNDIDKAKALECRDAVRKMMNLMVESEGNEK